MVGPADHESTFSDTCFWAESAPDALNPPITCFYNVFLLTFSLLLGTVWIILHHTGDWWKWVFLTGTVMLRSHQREAEAPRGPGAQAPGYLRGWNGVSGTITGFRLYQTCGTRFFMFVFPASTAQPRPLLNWMSDFSWFSCSSVTLGTPKAPSRGPAGSCSDTGVWEQQLLLSVLSTTLKPSFLLPMHSPALDTT